MWSNMFHKPACHAGIPRYESSQSQPALANHKESNNDQIPDVNLVNELMEKEQGDDGESIDSLVNLMREMKRVQEINKNTVGLTDEERRKNAADVMIKLS